MRVILALRLSQGEFHASLGYKERSDFRRKAFVKHIEFQSGAGICA